MSSPWVTSTDVVRYAIADTVRKLGGDEEAIDDIATAATYAIWCSAFTTGQSR
ncbi:hypothetical protein MANY_30980 [Mycolicibacterium anyangense]|uniref:Uncharacterized protein n=1 Tax=Mycolicibacterium anyangense TaxID=1431246 RepID=A0A6N4WF04_9MYCO|nr:hypothetical protein [Mycolicibacterium anyangense]BBZ77761.1 hypothetical protein MANY_30980 [Mycolicibacterium anyangense]